MPRYPARLKNGCWPKVVAQSGTVPNAYSDDVNKLFRFDVNMDSGHVNNGFRGEVNRNVARIGSEYSHPRNEYSHQIGTVSHIARITHIGTLYFDGLDLLSTTTAPPFITQRT